MEQEQWLQLKITFLLGCNLKIVIQWGGLTFGGEGEIKIWWGRFFKVGGNEQIFGWRGGLGGLLPPIPPVGRTLHLHLICGNKQNWLLNLNLIYKTLWTGPGSGLLISRLEKLSQFCLNSFITLVTLMGKWMGLLLSNNHLLRCWA